MTLSLMTAGADAPDLSDMTKAQLLAYAEENGIPGVSGTMKKADIISVLEGSDGKHAGNAQG